MQSHNSPSTLISLYSFSSMMTVVCAYVCAYFFSSYFQFSTSICLPPPLSNKVNEDGKWWDSRWYFSKSATTVRRLDASLRVSEWNVHVLDCVLRAQVWSRGLIYILVCRDSSSAYAWKLRPLLETIIYYVYFTHIYYTLYLCVCACVCVLFLFLFLV